MIASFIVSFYSIRISFKFCSPVENEMIVMKEGLKEVKYQIYSILDLSTLTISCLSFSLPLSRWSKVQRWF